MPRPRLRDLNITIGDLPTGPHNAITDVAGVLVGHATLIHDEPRVARTGVTVIMPRANDLYRNQCYGAFHSLNGNGEMTGVHWLAESGMIGSPLAITNTHQVGVVRDALVEHETNIHPDSFWLLPIVAETYDGWLNDINAFHLTKEHLFAALNNAQDGPVTEGCVGGGTGMICHGFKGGIGTSSRVVAIADTPYTVGVLVQANYGSREDLRLDGIPVGRLIDRAKTPAPRDPIPSAQQEKDGSIIVIVATDAPLLPFQCKRLAQRATIGLAQVGGYGHNSSGDIFLAFATGNPLPSGTVDPTERTPKQPLSIQMLPNELMDPLFHATADATAEAILNALCTAETMTGFQGRTVHALPVDELQEIWQKYQDPIQ
ncbi:MAG: P1 family peptidase [Caldilineaceae bacterium]|nr:P1 family peptidase [Caldilineaceae bacterium]